MTLLVRVKHDEACEVAVSTKTEDRVGVFLQIEEIQQQCQFDEIHAVKNSSQVKYKMKKPVEVQTEDDKMMTLSKPMLHNDRSSERLIYFSKGRSVKKSAYSIDMKEKITVIVMELIKEQDYSSIIISI